MKRFKLPGAIAPDGDGLLKTADTDAVLARNLYGIFAVPAKLLHRPAAKSLIQGHIYEPDTIAFLCRHGAVGDIVHAGTFFGDFLPALSLAYRANLVWAFEPVPLHFAFASFNIAINGLKNVRLAHAALTSDNTVVQMETEADDGTPLGGASRVTHTVPHNGVSAKGRRLDDAIPDDRHICVIQLDVEGHEKQALLGAAGIIRRCSPILVLEDFSDREWLAAQFPDQAYEFRGRLHENSVFAATGSGYVENPD